MQTNDLYSIELLEIELFDRLTVCKQMINWIVSDTEQYLEPFDFDLCLQIKYI